MKLPEVSVTAVLLPIVTVALPILKFEPPIVPETDDPVADFFSMGRAYYVFAIAKPQRYQLMFGTVAPAASFGDPQTPNNALRLTLPYLSLGSGLSSKPVVYIGEGGKRSIITQQETGALTSSEFTGSTVSPGRKSWRRLPLR